VRTEPVTAHREFCTLFDSNYLFKAVAMHNSLLRFCPSFHLTAFCFDDLAAETIERLGLPSISTVPLADLESHDAQLLSTKRDRSPVEYCWTATPALPLYLFDKRRDLSEVTYIDADLLFFADPAPLFAEMGHASILITPHRFAPEYLHQVRNGIYNVQFLTFRRDESGLTCLHWWHDRCIEWCYARFEDGKLGDQKYLDDWPEQFEGLHVLEHKGGGLAPWNITRYEIGRSDSQVFVDTDPLIFFHYRGVRLLERGDYYWRPPGYSISRHNKRLIYDPYLEALDEAVKLVRAVNPGFTAGFEAPPPLLERGWHHTRATRAQLVRRIRRPLARQRQRSVLPRRSAPDTVED
jgi:hypothetical protein